MARLDTARAGRGFALLLHGDPGIGRTSALPAAGHPRPQNDSSRVPGVPGARSGSVSALRARARYVVSRLRRRGRDRVVRAAMADAKTHREDLAARYLHGDGIEIGALNFPLRLPAGARVRYVDRQPQDELIAEYGAMYPGAAIVAPDVIDDGERLTRFDDASLDFVVANHMLEHTEDPVGALGHHLRVLRPGGIWFAALPDPRHNHDAPRPRTTVEHVLRDHADGPAGSRRGHYEEWARLVERVAEADVAERATQLEADAANVHFHVWEPEGFARLLLAIDDLPAELELIQRSGAEFVTVLRRR